MDDRFATMFSEAQPGLGNDPEPRPAQKRYLILLSGGIPGTMVPLSTGELSIGRFEENGLSLPEPSVSRRHASLRIDEAGQAWLSDQGSTNGTFRNGHRVSPFDTVRTQDGDRIRLGTRVVLKYACPDPEEERFQKAMFERTVRDPLTGLFNRSYFLDQIRLLATRCSGRGLGLAVLMLDVDHFKSINDRLGHDGGDVVLKEIARLIRQATRTEDLVARYGGEEFAIALPVTTHEMARDRAEKIRAAISQTPMKVEDRKIKVTASLGVAFSPPSLIRNFDALITAADRSLYLAKNGGRNRVICGVDSQMDTPKSWALADLS